VSERRIWFSVGEFLEGFPARKPWKVPRGGLILLLQGIGNGLNPLL